MLKRLNNVRSDDPTAESSGRLRALRGSFAWTFVAVWSVVVVSGMGLLAAYANHAGKSSPAPSIISQSDKATAAGHRLYMFLHPRCPCSVASVSELARIMSRCAARLDATVY